jgi:hypothetical protein
LLIASGPAKRLDAQTAPALTPAFRADIERLMEVTGTSALSAQMGGLVIKAMLDNLREKRPDIPERVLELALEAAHAEMQTAMNAEDGMKGQMVALYSRHFTPDEVRALLAFYASDIGRKLVSTAPMMMEEGATIGRQWAERNAFRIQAAVESRLRQEGLLPEGTRAQ